MPTDIALEKATADLSSLSPFIAAAKAGCDFKEGKFHLPFFNRLFLVDHSSSTIKENISGPPLSRHLKLVLLHYLIKASGAPVAGDWITYRYLPGANFFEARFQSMGILPLQRRFGQDIEGFREACCRLGGDAMSRTGDASYRFKAFPNIPMACILYLGDEDVESSINLLFDAASPNYLPTEDLSYVGSYLAFTLIKLALARVTGKAKDSSAGDNQGEPCC